MITDRHKTFKTTIIVLGLVAGLLAGERALSYFKIQPASSPSISLLNTELVDHYGAEVKFVTDIVGGRIVAINFIYTDCHIACPVVSAIFSKLQDQLEDRLTADVRLVSVSLNPEMDTPERLRTYAGQFHASSEWVWLTGKKTNIVDLLKQLNVYNTDYNNHAPVIIVGDPISGEWTRFYGLTSPETIKNRIDELLDARNQDIS